MSGMAATLTDISNLSLPITAKPPNMQRRMYYNNQDVSSRRLPVPRLGPGELLIRTRASGICGSDLMEWYRIQKAPLVLGPRSYR